MPDEAPEAAGPAPPRAFALEPFLDHLRFERGLAEQTLASYDHDVTRLARFAASLGRRDPAEVSTADLRRFVLLLKDLGLAPASIARNVSAIRTYFRFLLGENLVVADPSERIDAPRAWKTLPDVLSVAEVGRLLETPDLSHPLAWRDRALLEFAYASGVRVSELTGLRVRHLHLDDELASVVGKGSKERLVPIGRRAIGALSIYLRETRPRLDRGEAEGRVFLNARGRPLTRMGVWKILRGHVRGRRHHPARLAAHAPALVRHAPAGGRRGPGGRAGDAGARGHLHHAGVHARGPHLPGPDAPQLPPAGVGGGGPRRWCRASKSLCRKRIDTGAGDR
jgi:integrase/recombinase XerD